MDYGFKYASELQIGDKVQSQSGDIYEISNTSIEKLDETIKVYNFEVEDWHTYYVTSEGILVHNMCKTSPNASDNSSDKASDTVKAQETTAVATAETPVSEGGSSSRTVGKNQTTVYRVIRSDENPINGLSAKNPTRNMSVEGHIISGSRNKGSQYISTTTDINVAEYYASKDGCRIVEIDLNKLSSDVPIYDLSTDYGRNMYLKGITAHNFAKSSSEVLIEGYIPSEAIKLH